jgi:hypothetical protein
LFVELHRAIEKLKLHIDLPRLRQKLDVFYEAVDAVSAGQPMKDEDVTKYYKAALQASNDRGNRILRGQIIEKIIAESRS